MRFLALPRSTSATGTAALALGALAVAAAAALAPAPVAWAAAPAQPRFGGDARVEASVRAMFAERLGGDDGRVTVEEMQRFLELMDPHGGRAATVTIDSARAALAQFDADRSGDVTAEEFADTVAAFPWPSAPGGAGGSVEEAVAANLPAEIHLAPAASTDAMTVSWVASANYSAATPPLVQYGNTSGALNERVVAASSTYNVGSPGFFGTIFTATLTGLAPGTRYYYRVGAEGAWSRELFFVAAAATAPANVSIAMYGDQGVIPFGWAVMKELVAAHAADPFDAVLHVGDLAYAGITSTGEYEPTWDAWGAMIQPLAQQIPYATTVGNHEKYFNYTSFRTRYLMPGDTEGGRRNFWFSFDFAGIHFTSMSTEHNYSAGSEQYEWLRRDMSSPAARSARWRVLGAHRPFLSSDADEFDSHRPGAPLLSDIEPLLMANAYDLVETGHMHCAELVLPSIGGKPVVSNDTRVWTRPGAPAYVVQGNAGALIVEKWVSPQPEWSAFRDQLYGYGRANFIRLTGSGAASLNRAAVPCPSNCTDAMHYQFMGAKTGSPRHEFWLCK